MAYPSYLNFNRNKDITPEEVYQLDEEALKRVDQLIYLAHKYNLHVSINLHRAPGYCINSGFHEPYNLWFDKEAQMAFLWHWEMWANRYKNISREKISFDLLNEPAMISDMNNQHAAKEYVPGTLYGELVETTAQVIWKVNPDPSIISHYKAPWAMKEIDNLPPLKYPGQVGDEYLSREMLEKFYAPWIKLVQSGTGVHCGECGCYNKTPHNIFLAWFGDVVYILTSSAIGFSLWNFRGAFGILDSGRKDVEYENWQGHKLDRKLLDLIRKA